MNREQMIAWLTLEGRRAYNACMGRARYVAINEDQAAWLRYNVGPEVTISTWPHDKGPEALFNIFSMKELQLIYQEIIKHEKD